jgi:hypothetical protein
VGTAGNGQVAVVQGHGNHLDSNVVGAERGRCAMDAREGVELWHGVDLVDEHEVLWSKWF